MKKYLYLREPWMATTWTAGGTVPLFVASTYRNKERSGVKTPDEVQQIDYSSDHRGYFDIDGGMTVTDCMIIDNPHSPPRILSGKQWHEDGLVLCLSSAVPCWETMRRLEKQCCVCIEDVEALKAQLDEQVGSISEMRDCMYTWGHNRNHFLKSAEDSWQAEFRLFWKDRPNQTVTLPGGVGTAIPLAPPKTLPRLGKCFCGSGVRYKDCHGKLM